MTISLPLFVDIPRKTKKDKRVYINLNNYRNIHYIVSNQAKILFKQQVLPQILWLPKMDKITIEYILFPKTQRRCDLDNMCCVIHKFFCDALVEIEKLPDDNYDHVVGLGFVFGAVDKNNPRVEANINVV